MNGVVAAAFAGYNWETSSGMVFGAEISAQLNHNNGDGDEESSYPEDYTITSLIDAKIKAGKGFGNVLAYGFAGVSSATGTAYEGGEYSYIFSGFNYGVGAEMMMSDKLSVGVEHVMRSLYHPYDENMFNSATTQLRVAFRF